MKLVASATACALLACAACSESRALQSVDFGPDAPTGPPIEDDAGADAPQAGSPTIPSVVFVNGLIEAGQSGLDDVRVCVGAGQYALPDAVPMPMTNYPGIARGTGIDLGAVANGVTLHVYKASELHDDAAWTPRIPCLSWSGHKHTDLTLSLDDGPNLVVLVDDPKGADGIGVRSAPLSEKYSGEKDTLQIVAAEFSTFAKAGETLEVSVGGSVLGSGSSGMLAQTATGLSTAGGLEAIKIRFERTGADAAKVSFEQTLGSVQFLADPTTTTATYYDRRSNYAFVLVGDAGKPVSTDERSLLFNGKGLHVVAVPYTAVVR